MQDTKPTTNATPREYRIRCRWTGDSMYTDEARCFLAGMVAATYGPVDYSNADDDDAAAFVIETYGTKPPSANHLMHWREIARRILPGLLMEEGEVEIGEPREVSR